MTEKIKRIGIITNCTWNVVNFRLDLILSLREKGFEPVILAPEDEYAQRLTDLNLPFFPIKHLDSNGTNPFSDLLFLMELIRLFKKHRLDVVLLYTIKPNIYGSIAAKCFGVRSIATVTGLGFSFLNSKTSAFIARKLYRMTFNFTDKIVFHNPDDLVHFTEKGLVEAQKCKVIPGSGIDLDRFSPVKKSKPDKGPVRFLFVGRLLYDKGLLELLQAYDKLQQENNNAELWLLGEIDNKNSSAFTKTELALWEKNIGSLKYKGVTDDVRPYIADVDVVVLPSYREGLPKTILEAMAMGKAIIVSDVPGCRETIVKKEPINGYFCQSKDPESLYKQLLKMIQLSEQERDQMGQIGRELVREKFESRQIIASYEKLIDEIS